MAEFQPGNTTKAEVEKRQRKKKLISDVRQQLEFYFSSANLQKDLFMKELLAKNDYIKFDIFNKFNKMKSLSTEQQILKKAVETSNILELSTDELGVKRKFPIQIKENEIDCTIYIENVPPIADHNWIKNIFSQYGTIDYVSLPKFKNTDSSKGFAFVEFQSESQAQNAIGAFGGMVCGGEMKYDELRSIQTYYKTGQEIEKSNKRSLSDEDVDEEGPSKKIKKESDDNSGKKKKKRKRKNKEKEEVETEGLYLKVMSKRQWKNLRNEYLDTMRKNRKFSQEYFSDYGESFSLQNQLNKQPISLEEVAKMPVYIPNTIVQIEVKEIPQDKKALKQSIIEEHTGVAYIEFDDHVKLINIRFNSADDAAAFIISDTFDEKNVLKGKEEEAYWENLYACWVQRRNKKIKKLSKNVKNEMVK